MAPIRQSQTFPPNLNAPTVFESFSPDSGGVKTQLIIRGQNFGTDTAYLKVTVNNKRAAIVGVADDVIYAIVLRVLILVMFVYLWAKMIMSKNMLPKQNLFISLNVM